MAVILNDSFEIGILIKGIDACNFAMFHLFSHGVIKLAIVLLLWRKKTWAYPASIVVIVLFIVYQVLRWTGTHSVFMVFLTIFDILMIWLTLVEYRRLRAKAS